MSNLKAKVAAMYAVAAALANLQEVWPGDCSSPLGRSLENFKIIAWEFDFPWAPEGEDCS